MMPSHHESQHEMMMVFGKKGWVACYNWYSEEGTGWVHNTFNQSGIQPLRDDLFTDDDFLGAAVTDMPLNSVSEWVSV